MKKKLIAGTVLIALFLVVLGFSYKTYTAENQKNNCASKCEQTCPDSKKQKEQSNYLFFDSFSNNLLQIPIL